MNSIKLSICIPTYNFGRFIGETLDSIARQMTDEVEVVILDGGSTDNTEEVVRGFQNLFPGISYHRLEKRGGIDRDMAKTVELARGRYCWLFSADDLMKGGAIQDILMEIHQEFDVYLCGLTLYNRDMKRIREHPILNTKSTEAFQLGDPEDRLRYFELAQTTTAFFSFLGSLIFKKSKWDSIPLDESFVGSLWAHVARFFRMMPDGLRLKYLPVSYLSKRCGNDSFLDKGLAHRIFISVDGYHRLAETFFGESSAEARHVRRVLVNEFPSPFLLYAKIEAKTKGRREDPALLDKIVEKLYKDPGIKNRLHRLIYRWTPLFIFKAAWQFYLAMNPARSS